MTTARYLKDYQVPAFSIEAVSLVFELHDSCTNVTNSMQIHKIDQSEDNLTLVGEHLSLVSIAIDGEELSSSRYLVTESELVIHNVSTKFELTIITQINPLENKALEGLYKSGGAFCTQCEAEGFRRISYYLDRPDVMSIFTTEIIADKTSYPHLLSNGNKIAFGDLDDGRHYVRWHDPHKKPSYLFALVAGDFDLLSDEYVTIEDRKVALEIYVDKGSLNKAVHAMNSLKKSMKWDEDTFELAYDLDVYMIVAVDFFNMGAMENKGLNVFNSKYVLADTDTATDTDYFNIEAVIAHEYFHNWTGNRVTCRDWFQLSLKEGLTVFRDQQFSADMHSKTVTRIQNVRTLRAQQFPEDAGPMAHPIRPEKVKEMNNFYTLTVYEKGAEVIRMMHTLLGQDKFKLGMDLYFDRHDGKAVTCDDFVDAMQDAANVDLSLFRRWYSQSGTPRVSIKSQLIEESGDFCISIQQEHPVTLDGQTKENLHIPLKIEVIEPSTGRSIPMLLELKSNFNTWTFKDIAKDAIVAALADFSAPVIVETNHSNESLYFVALHAKNAFLRWDAAQQLLARHIIAKASDLSVPYSDDLLVLFTAIFEQNDDFAFIAEQATLPTIEELLAMSSQLDVLSLDMALRALKIFIADNLTDKLIAIYESCKAPEEEISSDASAKRALRNVCLSYLATTQLGESLVQKQYFSNANMTNALAAIKSAAINGLSCFEEMMNHFEQKWYENTLVMDKWFSINAMYYSNSALNHIQKLTEHPLFTLENPNRARSLIGAFAMSNTSAFHAIDGRGYEFLTEQIIKMDKINPQVASRLVTPLIQYQALDKERQALIIKQLKRIQQQESLSRDLEEKITATLN